MSCNLIQIVAALVNAFNGPIGQPTKSQVLYLCHFDSTTSATTFTDAVGNNWSLRNGAYFDTATVKMGASSLRNQTNYNATITGAAGVAVGTQDFTVEMWIYPTSLTNAFSGLFNLYKGNSTNGMHLAVGSNGALRAGNNSVDLLASGAGAITLNNWQHVAFTRQGTQLSLWVNGVRVAISQNGSSINCTSTELYLGWSYAGNSNSGYYIGYTDEFRLVRGLAVYTENFTPYDQPFSVPAN